MKDVFSQLYNGFLLRDILGYFLPGSLVLISMSLFFSILSGGPETFNDLLSKVPQNWFIYTFMFCLCYACGHSLSGIFFHLLRFNRFFSYTSKKLFKGENRDEWNNIWIEHLAEYREASSKVSEQLQYQVERYAALIHFTGHFSAGILVAIFFIVLSALVKGCFASFYYALPLLALLPGTYCHFRVLIDQRYELEKKVIKIASLKKKPNIGLDEDAREKHPLT